MERSQKIIHENSLTRVYADEENHVVLYEYTPTLTALLYCNMEPMRFVQWVRLLEEFWRKGRYRVYYLALDGVLVGYNVLSPGGRRLSCSTSRDIVSGPVFVDPAYRCRGYSQLMQKLCYAHCGYDYDFVYNWIEKTNLPSIKSCEKIGFRKVGELTVSRVRRRLIPAENGTCIVFRLANPRKQE